MRRACPRIRAFGEGRPVLLLHGWAASGDFFEPLHGLVRHGLRLVIPDLPGHGPLAASDAELTIADLSEALSGLLDTMPGAVLVGWSMGASVALDYIARHGAARVAALVILDMTPKVANAPDWDLGLSNGHRAEDMRRVSLALGETWRKFPPSIARSLFPLGARPDVARLARFEATLAANDGPTMAALWRSLAGLDQRALIGGLPVPLQLVLGGRSALYGPALARWYRDRLPAGHVRVLDDAGHAPHWDDPDAVAAVIRAAAGG